MIADYKLYLDDERFPKSSGWKIVRSYEEFISTVKERGVPSCISFDHDLGEGSLSGHECVKWLIHYGIENDIPVEEIEINVHSANPVGKENIEKLFDSFVRFKKRDWNE